jgi:two-component system chemotaxis response regulator CheY
MKVIVVDDASFMRRVFADIVKEKGHEVVGEASTGKEAIELFKELRPDLILMDIVMPDATGLEAVKDILAIDPDARVVIISAAEDLAIRKDVLALGARGFVRKPPEPEVLRSLLDEIGAEAKVESPEARLSSIYTSLLRELTQFVRSYFGAEADEALEKALHSFAEKEADLDMDQALTITLKGGKPQEINERLNRLLEAGRASLTPAIGETQADEIFREAFKIVYQRAPEGEIEKLEVMFPPWLEAEVVRMERANWEANLDMLKKKYGIKGGAIYMVEEHEPKEAYNIFSTLTITGTPGMILSRTSPKEVQERFKVGPAKMIWLTYNKINEVECIEPTGPGLIYKRVSEFIQEHGKCVVMMDGLEYIISQTTFGGAQKLVQAIHDDVMLTDSIILVPLDINVLDQKQIHFLSRELKNIKPAP